MLSQGKLLSSRKITFFKENYFIQKARWLRGCQAQFSSVQSLSHVWLCVTPWTASPQASLSITNTQSSPKPMSTESVIPSNHLILSSPSPPALSHSQNQDLFQSPSLASCLTGCYAVWLPSGKESTCQCRRRRRHGCSLWVEKIPWSRKQQPASVFLPEKSHGQRSWQATV